MKRILILTQQDLCPNDIYVATDQLTFDNFSIPGQVLISSDVVYYLTPSRAVLVLKSRSPQQGEILYGEIGNNLHALMQPGIDRCDALRQQVLEYIITFGACTREDILKQFSITKRVFEMTLKAIEKTRKVNINGHGMIWLEDKSNGDN